MVIRITSRVEVSIQAVSPELSAGAGASAAKAGRASSRASEKAMRFMMSGPRCGPSKGFGAGLAGANAKDVFERRDENLAGADLAGAGALLDGLDQALQVAVGHG